MSSPHFAFPPLGALTKKIILVLFGAFIVQAILEVWVGMPVFRTLALNPTELGAATLWQIITYPLVELPAAIFKLLLSLLMLWWFLSPFEHRYGRIRTLQLCAVAVLSAALLALSVGYLSLGGGLFLSSYLAGADPIGLAALCAFALIHRRSQILLFGVFAMKPMHIILLSIGLSVLMFLISRDVTTLCAHLGAMGGGAGYVKWLEKPPRSKRRRPRRGVEASLHVLQGGRPEPPRWMN